MFNLKKILSLTLAAAVVLYTFCSCGKKTDEAYIYFELLSEPKTLDPQIASNDSELLIVRNIYEGLLRCDQNGEIVNGTAEKYEYDGLTYTFKLKDGLVWSNGTPLTAYDYEYAFKRAVDPKNKAPFASRLFAIENAEAINNGSADISALGVTASDNTTLTINMIREDSGFLKTLTTSVCMPCNEEFFENSVGKYGRDAECIISNGSYRLAKWNKEDFGIRIYKNEKYKGNFTANNGAVFISCVPDESQVSRFNDNSSDISFLSCDELRNAENSELNIIKIQNICWFLTISRNYSGDIRRALAGAFSPDIYSKSLPEGFEVARSIYPDILNINADGVGLGEYNIENSKAIMSAQISNMPDSKFPSSTLYYYETDGINGIKSTATAIVGHWQQNLSTFVNIEPSKNLAVLQNEISKNDVDFALFPISVTSDDFGEYARNFSGVSHSDSPDILQKELLNGNHILPVAYQSTNIAYRSCLKNVNADKFNGYLDFSFITKTE